MLLLTLRGTPTIYYGDELGMTDVAIPAGLEQDPARFHGPTGGRDPERTPMRWDRMPGAGFTSGHPWLPIGEVGSVNVADQRGDARSMLSLYRRLLTLRREEPALAVGDWAPIRARGGVLAYERMAPGRRFIVALELAGEPAGIDLEGETGRIVLSTELDRVDEPVRGTIALRRDEGVIIEVLGERSSRGLQRGASLGGSPWRSGLSKRLSRGSRTARSCAEAATGAESGPVRCITSVRGPSCGCPTGRSGPSSRHRTYPGIFQDHRNDDSDHRTTIHRRLGRDIHRHGTPRGRRPAGQ
jgi:hypothetical protein